MNGRAHVQVERTLQELPRDRRPSFMMELPPFGAVAAHDAEFFFCSIEVFGNGETVSVAAGQRACACGCNRPATAFAYRMTPENARAMAGQLLSLAAKVEQAAGQQAAAALHKAAGK